MTDKQPPKKPARKTAPKPARKPVPKHAAKKAAPKQPAVKKTAARKVAAKTPVPAKKAAPKGKGKTTAQDKAKATASAGQSVTDLVGEAKRAVGRPTKYSDDFIPQMIAYFNIETERTEQTARKDKDGNTIVDKDGQPILETIVVKNKFPTLERFASKIGVTRLTLSNWAEEKNEDGTPVHPEFLYTYTRAKDLQTALLTEGGLEGTYEPRVVNFALKNIAGWKDQIEQTVVADITTTDNAKLDDIYEQGIRAAAAAKQAALTRKLTGIVPGTAGQVKPDDAE